VGLIFLIFPCGWRLAGDEVEGAAVVVGVKMFLETAPGLVNPKTVLSSFVQLFFSFSCSLLLEPDKKKCLHNQPSLRRNSVLLVHCLSVIIRRTCSAQLIAFFLSPLGWSSSFAREPQRATC
jgi:hypothetical protein